MPVLVPPGGRRDDYFRSHNSLVIVRSSPNSLLWGLLRPSPKRPLARPMPEFLLRGFDQLQGIAPNRELRRS